MVKTTIELSDTLLARAKERAARDATTLRDVVESALREFLTGDRRHEEFHLRDASVSGRGLRPEFADQPFRALRDAAYEGRGNVIAVDTNILVYAHRQDSDFHDAATEAVRSLAEGRASWAIPWPCIHEFYAIVTHPRIFDPPTKGAAAVDQVDAWLESPSLALIGEPHLHWQKLREILTKAKVVGPRVHDARIAAICAGHRVRELWSADRDFSRFAALKVRNPFT